MAKKPKQSLEDKTKESSLRPRLKIGRGYISVIDKDTGSEVPYVEKKPFGLSMHYRVEDRSTIPIVNPDEPVFVVRETMNEQNASRLVERLVEKYLVLRGIGDYVVFTFIEPAHYKRPRKIDDKGPVNMLQAAGFLYRARVTPTP